MDKAKVVCIAFCMLVLPRTSRINNANTQIHRLFRTSCKLLAFPRPILKMHPRPASFTQHGSLPILADNICRAKAGHHDTTVHEKVAPAVVNEEIKKIRHEEAQTAIDREVHQDHYHTSVQPIKDREVLPEQHSHTTVPVEHREHVHGNPEAIKARLEQERLQFQSHRVDAGVQETHSVAPVIAGEHVHHHVHEVCALELCIFLFLTYCLDHSTRYQQRDNPAISRPHYCTHP